MEEKKTENKEPKKKETKKKEPKKKIVPFNKIDITTATEDEIIQSGLKDNTKADTTCYLIMFIIFVAAVLPPALRLFIPRPITKTEEEITYNYLTCYKTTVRDNYELTTTLKSNYRDGEVNDVTFEFQYFKRNDQAKDGYEFAEIEELANIKENGIKADRTTGKATITINYDSNPALKQHEVLKEYSYFYTTQLNILSNEKGYSCSSKTESKKEIIDVKTRKKVE